MIYKLRNAGGVESWYSADEAAVLLAQEDAGWTKVEEAADAVFDAPIANTAPTADPGVPVSEPAPAPEPEVPAAPAKKGKGR
jgi:hypothetical protein